MKGGITIFVDSWCPQCKRFGEWVQSKDEAKRIEIKDIRADLDHRIDRNVALNRMASIDQYGKVGYGFVSIALVFNNLANYRLLYPISFFLSFTKVGSLIYDHLAVRRTIIPLHCRKEECHSKMKKE